MNESRDDLEVDALVTDRYLDSLLAARDRRSAPEPDAAGLDPNVLRAAGALEAQLARVHPSFRFEERLATDLQVAARQRRSGRPIRAGGIRRLEARQPVVLRPFLPPDANPSRGQVPRPLLIGGALTSAALSIAGAYVAWRRGRPPLDPMVRAVRAAHQTGISRRIPGRASRLALARATRNR